MEQYKLGKFDVVVIGAGHAGCEAGLAAARMGKKTLLLSINLEAVANMFCNPAIGGTGKGHLVREIDALGGQMGINIDRTYIQSRILNVSKGPAVHSLRAQADKRRYHEEIKKTLELAENLLMKQGEAVDIDFDEDGRVRGVLLRTGAYYECKAVVIATAARTECTPRRRSSGRCGSWGCRCGALRPARLQGAWLHPLIFPRCRCRRAILTRCPSHL